MGRDRFDHSVDHSDNTKPVCLQRVEVITGVERRRNWPISKKLEIVAESEAEGAVVSEVARRHGIHPQQLFGWRAKLRKAEKDASSITASVFTPVVVEPSAPAPNAAGHPNATSLIEIVLGSARVRVSGPVGGKTLVTVLKALKVLA
jgi:transposase